MAKATAAPLDFTNVKDGGGQFNKKHQQEGDYAGKVTKVEDAKSKADNIAMWLFTIEAGTGSYPYYCKHQENQLWKIRNLLVAAGVSVPKKRVKVDPNILVGKSIGVTLQDTEYEGKVQSEIGSIFPASELEAEDEPDEDEAEEVEEAEIVEDETIETEDDDLEEIDIEDI
jgi:hypothetical protein